MGVFGRAASRLIRKSERNAGQFVERIMAAREEEAPGSDLPLAAEADGERDFHLPSEEAIGQMPLADLWRLIDPKHRVLPGQVKVGFVVAIYRRAMEIAYHSHGTSSDDRTLAVTIATATREHLLTGACPAELRTAIEGTEGLARDFGYGTLLWLLEEHKLPADQAIQFTMRPENAHLVGGLLDTLKPDARARVLPVLIAELLRARRVANSHSLVFVAHGLAVAHERATVALFDQTELAALRNAHRDYEAALAVLVGLGLLPVGSSARTFAPELPRSQIAECVSLLLLGLWSNEREREPELRTFLSNLDAKWQDAFEAARFVLCVHLAYTVIYVVFGGGALKALREDLPAKWVKLGLPWDGDAEKFTAHIDSVEKEAEHLRQNVDGLVLGLVTLRYVDGQLSEADLHSPTFNDVTTLLTRARVQFLSELHFRLRAMCEGYRLIGPNNPVGEADLMTRGLENPHPSLWGDAVFSPPFSE
jgi:hypothetical protein